MKFFKYSASLFLLFSLLGCNSPISSSKTSLNSNHKNLNIALETQPVSLDPNLSSDTAVLSVSNQIFNTLLGTDKNGEIIPELAKSWEFLDSRNIKFQLREGVKFHNGSPLSVEDVIFSIEKAKLLEVGKKYSELIETVKKINDSSFVVTLREPYSPILYLFANPVMSIHNRKYVEEMGDEVRFKPLGTGPFAFDSWITGESLKLKAFPQYFDGKPEVDSITFKMIPENINRITALERGEVDIAYDLHGDELERLRKSDKLKTLSFLGSCAEFIVLNTSIPPFNNTKFRQAVESAINKKIIAEEIYDGYAEPAASVVNPSILGSSSGTDIFPYNPTFAKVLLEQSGIKDKRFTAFVNSDPIRIQLANEVKRELEEIGLEMQIKVLDESSITSQSSQGSHQMIFIPWNSTTSDADSTLFPLLHSSCIYTRGNLSHYNNKDYDALIEAAHNTENTAERLEFYAQAQKMIEQDVPVIPLVYLEENVGFSNEINGIVFSPYGYHELKDTDKKNNQEAH